MLQLGKFLSNSEMGQVQACITQLSTPEIRNKISYVLLEKEHKCISLHGYPEKSIIQKLLPAAVKQFMDNVYVLLNSATIRMCARFECMPY